MLGGVNAGFEVDELLSDSVSFSNMLSHELYKLHAPFHQLKFVMLIDSTWVRFASDLSRIFCYPR